MAQEAYWDEVVRPGLVKRASTKTEHVVPPPVMHFLHHTAKNLFIYGYSVHRRLAGGEYVVPSGSELSVRFDCETERWVADTDKDAEDFTVVILFPPTERTPVSYATAALDEIIRLNEMHERRAKRDAYNSNPTVFATVDRHAMDTSKGVVAVPAQAARPGVEDYADLIDRRSDILRRSTEATETLNRERRGYGQVGGGIQRPAAQEHTTYYVDDGRRAEQARHLHGRS